MVTRRSGNTTVSEPPDEEAAPSQRKTTLQRRKTTANAGTEVNESSTPATSTKKTVNAARKSMPSRLENGSAGPPTTPQKTPSSILRQSVTQASPLRTPGGSLRATAVRRIEDLASYSIDLMEFYGNYVAQIRQSEGIFDEEEASQLESLWGKFSTFKKYQTYPKKDNNDHFLDADMVLKGNLIESDPDLEEEMENHISQINRATFAHYILQYPLRHSQDEDWTVVKLNALINSSRYEFWPIVDISELEACRDNFFKYIVPKRNKAAVTVDDLYLYLDLNTQIVIYQMEDYFTDKNATRRRINCEKAVKAITSTSQLSEVLEAWRDKAAPAYSASNDSNLAKYNTIAAKRKARIEGLKFDPVKLHREFSFPETMTSLFSYISQLERGSIALVDYGKDLIMPRHIDQVFSPTFRLEELNEDGLVSAFVGIGVREGDGANLFLQKGLDVSQQDQSESSALAQKKAIRFNKSGRLQEVDVEINNAGSNIIRNQGVKESVRDRHFDEDEDTSNPFLEDQVEAAKKKRQQTGKKRGRPLGNNKKGKAIKSTRTSRKNMIEDDDDDEEEEGDESGEQASGEQAAEIEIEEVEAAAELQITPRDARLKKREAMAKAAEKAAAEGEDDDDEDADDEDADEDEEEESTPRGTRTRPTRKGKEKETPSKKDKGKGKAPAIAAFDNLDDFEVDEEEIELDRAKREKEKEKEKEKGKRKRTTREDSGDDEYLPSGSQSKKRKAPSVRSESRDTADIKVKVPRTFKYATGGNVVGRKKWTADETACLLSELEIHYPLYLQGKEDGKSYSIIKNILERHGENGSESNRLQDRNNAQLKDKARNEYAVRYKRDGQAPAWLEKWG